MARVLTGPQQAYRLQKMSFRILVRIYCHNIPTHTPQSGYHGVTEVAKTANLKSASVLVPLRRIQTPWSRTRKPFFGSKSEKKRFMIFDQKKGGVNFLNPPPRLPQKLQKVGFKWGGGCLGGVRTKNSLGDEFIGQNNDFTRG